MESKTEPETDLAVRLPNFPPAALRRPSANLSKPLNYCKTFTIFFVLQPKLTACFRRLIQNIRGRRQLQEICSQYLWKRTTDTICAWRTLTYGRVFTGFPRDSRTFWAPLRTPRRTVGVDRRWFSSRRERPGSSERSVCRPEAVSYDDSLS